MGLNDPQWGRKKGNSGPPDLDQMWRNFNKKLNNLLKRKGGGGGGSSGEGGGDNPRRYSGGIGLLLGLLLLLWVASGFYIVNEGQRGIVLRFGKYVESTQAGLRLQDRHCHQQSDYAECATAGAGAGGFRRCR